MREHSFATLVSTDAGGTPVATHLPTALSDEAERIVLHFHLARANPHAAILCDRASAMMVFLGPHAYMSPAVYPDLRRVPTWNYIAVHAYGDVEALTGFDAKDALLKSLIALNEPAYAAQWRALDDAFQHTMMGAIMAFRMTVTRLDSKFKLNQHRKEAHASMKSTYAAGDANEQALGRWMARLGL